jgi:hypothetical protein
MLPEGRVETTDLSAPRPHSRNLRMESDTNPKSTTRARDADAEVVAFLVGRSAPCPRCAYDLRDIPTARCPECGEPLVLRVGSPRMRFGWLVVAMAPGCFSGVAALFVLVPIFMTSVRPSPGSNLPLPIVAADAFGFVSAASVWFMYRHRHRIMAWTSRRQAMFAGSIWAVHIVMFALVLIAMLTL